jgi:3D (Asp-Asp-Asp) domain-containing protein
MRMRIACSAALAVVLLVATSASARPPRRGHPRQPVHPATLRMTATAYCERGKTRSGAQAQDGIVAADIRRLPIGTRLRIIAPGRAYAGAYTVMDTGSAIKGRDIDIFMPSCARARKFGRRIVNVRVLK